jgi:transposase-like protein
VPTRYPMEFGRDVIAVARRGDRSIGQVARSFGISESCLSRWLRVADREDGLAAGPPAPESEDSAELRERRKRNRQLEQENEILRRAAACFAGEVLPE